MITIDKIASMMQSAMNSIKTPAAILPSTLLYATAIQRTGLSASKIASQIISNNQALGIETGENPDGTPNIVNQYTYNVVKSVVDALKSDAVIHTVIPAGTILVEVVGANGGGPVTCTGSNILDATAMGLIR